MYCDFSSNKWGFRLEFSDPQKWWIYMIGFEEPGYWFLCVTTTTPFEAPSIFIEKEKAWAVEHLIL